MSAPLALAITTGEPAGIGPDITVGALLQMAGEYPQARFHVIGDARLLAERAAALGVAQAWARRLADGSVASEDICLLYTSPSPRD